MQEQLKLAEVGSWFETLTKSDLTFFSMEAFRTVANVGLAARPVPVRDTLAPVGAW